MNESAKIYTYTHISLYTYKFVTAVKFHYRVQQSDTFGGTIYFADDGSHNVSLSKLCPPGDKLRAHVRGGAEVPADAAEAVHPVPVPRGGREEGGAHSLHHQRQEGVEAEWGGAGGHEEGAGPRDAKLPYLH